MDIAVVPSWFQMVRHGPSLDGASSASVPVFFWDRQFKGHRIRSFPFHQALLKYLQSGHTIHALTMLILSACESIRFSHTYANV